jgi:hypothetical protein
VCCNVFDEDHVFVLRLLGGINMSVVIFLLRIMCFGEDHACVEICWVVLI